MKKHFSCLLVLCFFQIHAQIHPEFVSLRPRFVNSISFSYTGSIQTWIVPVGVTYIFADLRGAQGGTRTSPIGIGGLGGNIKSVINVTPGETLYIMVGGQPTSRVAVYGNGGNGGTNTANTTNVSFAGGGMTAIFRNSDTITNALLIAAGGGGGSNQRNGGNGGGTTGGTSISDATRGGKGGTQSAGGAAGSPLDVQVTNPTAGLFGAGGTGGIINTSTWNSGGGGGAGYYGGGGGAGGGNYFSGGGGGSSWSHSSNNKTENISGINMGHGKAIIYY